MEFDELAHYTLSYFSKLICGADSATASHAWQTVSTALLFDTRCRSTQLTQFVKKNFSLPRRDLK